MKNFLKPTIFKIIITIITVLVAFGGMILYSSNITVVEDKIVEPNLAIRALNYISSIILYPVRLITSLIDLTSNDIIQNSSIVIIATFVFLLLTILESYLIGCFISILINRK